MIKIPNGLSDRMIRFRAERNMNQRELASLCRLTVQTIGNIENGRRQGITKLTLAKIERVIGEQDGGQQFANPVL